MENEFLNPSFSFVPFVPSNGERNTKKMKRGERGERLLQEFFGAFSLLSLTRETEG